MSDCHRLTSLSSLCSGPSVFSPLAGSWGSMQSASRTSLQKGTVADAPGNREAFGFHLIPHAVTTKVYHPFPADPLA